MNKKQDYKDEVIEHTLKEEAVDTVISDKGIDIVTINVDEIITSTPYSVYALCKLYEYFQRN